MFLMHSLFNSSKSSNIQFKIIFIKWNNQHVCIKHFLIIKLFTQFGQHITLGILGVLFNILQYYPHICLQYHTTDQIFCKPRYMANPLYILFLISFILFFDIYQDNVTNNKIVWLCLFNKLPIKIFFWPLYTHLIFPYNLLMNS